MKGYIMDLESLKTFITLANTKYKNGITKQNLIEEDYLMCDFALQNVGQFIRSLFPKYHQFSFEINDCSKLIAFLIGSSSYSFLPENIAKPFIQDKTLRNIPLKDLEPPIINSYLIYKKTKYEQIKQMISLS